MLHEFIAAHRDEIIDRCLAKVAARHVSRPNPAAGQHGVPVFLDQLINVLRLGLEASPIMTRTALLHGQELQLRGWSASDVVHDYGDVCQSITELAIETDARISADDFRMLNRCLDDAIAGAITAYGHAAGAQTGGLHDTGTAERVTELIDAVQDEVLTAALAFDAIKTGRVGVGGSTGSVLDRSLQRVLTRIDRWRAATRASVPS